MQITLNLLLDRNGKETEDFARKRGDGTYAKGLKEDKLRIVCKCPFRHKALNESGIVRGPCLLTLNKQVIYKYASKLTGMNLLYLPCLGWFSASKFHGKVFDKF